MRKMVTHIRMFVWMTLLTGLIYPLLITVVGQLAMKSKADGSFVVSQNRIVGSEWIGQKFEGEKYFWSRPSAVEYNPLPSGGSNLSPTSRVLKKAVEERKEKILKAHGGDKKEIPAELLYASGSGVDPHISLPAAYFQMERVAKARNIPLEHVKELITSLAIQKTFGFLGEARINVLLLNIALDDIHKSNEIKN